MEMMSAITKFAATVPSTERIADMIAMAARESYAGAYGPSYLEIPRDVLDREVDLSKAVIPQPGKYRASTRSIGDPADIEKLADALVNAERPAVLYGQQVWMARGHEEAIALLRGLDIPGYFNGASRGLLPPGSPKSRRSDPPAPWSRSTTRPGASTLPWAIQSRCRIVRPRSRVRPCSGSTRRRSCVRCLDSANQRSRRSKRRAHSAGALTVSPPSKSFGSRGAGSVGRNSRVEGT